ncbi:FecR domain-containing protein [Rubripirellula obstinata]|uniref:FecR domain-containing protein n=1 Tax=Rubripirellula obstinata TaxID=406547 RepID=UPI00135B8CF0|nr:FecR domain-containing protein [Rubripirellula obstinata]
MIPTSSRSLVPSIRPAAIVAPVSLVKNETPQRSILSFAKVTQASGAFWDSGQQVDPSLHQLPGGKLTLSKGVLEITYRHGAVITVEGPSSFELINRDLVLLHTGQLTSRIPKAAVGFTIRTPDSDVIDLGTEAGVRVDASGKSEVHVFEGEVEVNVAANDQSQAIQRSLLSGEAGRLINRKGQRVFFEFESNRDDFVRSIGPRFVADPRGLRSQVLCDFSNDLADHYSISPEGHSSFSGAGGLLHGKIDPGTHDPKFQFKLQAKYDHEAFSFLRLAIRKNRLVETELFFTDQSGKVKASRKVVFPPLHAPNAFAETRQKVPSRSSAWQFDASSCRLDPIGNSGARSCIFDLDYLIADKYPTLGLVEFDADGKMSGWQTRSIANAVVADGVLRGTSQDADPYVLSRTLNVDAEKYNVIEFRLKVPPEAILTKVYWGKRGDAISEDKQVELPVFPDNQFHTFLIDMSRAPGWNETIHYLRLDPMKATRKSFEVDYIRAIAIPPSQLEEIFLTPKQKRNQS